MLRFIGALVVVLLIIGPLLERTGTLPSGILHDMVDIEVRAFADCVAWVRNMLNGHRT